MHPDIRELHERRFSKHGNDGKVMHGFAYNSVLGASDVLEALYILRFIFINIQAIIYS